MRDIMMGMSIRIVTSEKEAAAEQHKDAHGRHSGDAVCMRADGSRDSSCRLELTSRRGKSLQKVGTCIPVKR